MEQTLWQSKPRRGLPGAAAGDRVALVKGESEEGPELPAEAP